MPPLSLAGVMGITAFRCHSPHAQIPQMTLLCPAGFATSHAINIGVHSYLRILPVSNATRTASRSGPVLEMVIFAAPLEMIMEEGPDMHSRASLVVKVMLLQDTIIQNSGAK
jgi:hypothetical protein